jgi:hypothetical protein
LLHDLPAGLDGVEIRGLRRVNQNWKIYITLKAVTRVVAIRRITILLKPKTMVIMIF